MNEFDGADGRDDMAAMKTVLVSTTRQLEKKEAAIARLVREADVLRQIKSGIETYLGLSPDDQEDEAAEAVHDRHNGVPLDPAPTGPRGKQAIRLILREHPGVPLKVAQIASELQRRGWIDSPKRAVEATRTNVLRAMEAYPEIRRVGPGVYVYRDPDEIVLDDDLPTMRDLTENDGGPTSEGGEATAQPPEP